jgi:glycosyltransferase involved in cell wall biosynthesis
MLSATLGWPERDSELYRVGTRMEGDCLRLADAVYSSGDCSTAWCARHYGITAAAVPTLHTGVDTRLFRPIEGPKSARLTVAFVGRLVANKGVEPLLEACLRLAAEFPDLRLRLMGRGEQTVIARLERMAAESGRPEVLELAGFVDQGSLPGELGRAHVFAAPSLYEGGPGFVYLEAMACGLPVVACEGSGVSELLRAEDTGLLVPPGDTEALVVALRRLLTDVGLRDELGARARRMAVEQADSELCLDQLEEFYLEVVREASAGLAAAGGDG